MPSHSEALTFFRPCACTQTNEAKAAFERGGGGKRAEAVRLLAAAKHSGKPQGGAAKPSGVCSIQANFT